MNYSLFLVGDIFHYRFQVAGKRISRTTRVSDRTRADRIAEDAYREALSWAPGRRAQITVDELCRQWLSAHDGVVSAAHISGMERTRRLHLGSLHAVPIDELSTQKVEAWRSLLLTTAAPGHVNHLLRQLRLLAGWAVRRELIPKIPFQVKLQKMQKRPRVTLATDMTRAWLAAIDRHEGDRVAVRIAVRMMIAMGLRESETMTARWECLDWARARYTPPDTKGRESVPLPVPQWLIDFLEPLKCRAGLMCPREEGGQHSRSFTRIAILAANRAVGAPHITPHRLRGSFATLLSETGTPVQDIQRTLRHKDIRTTLGYLETDDARVEAAQKRIASAYGL